MSATDRRPRDPERPQRIVRAVRDLVREVGIAAITHRTVAERAQVPLGSTTYYFDTIDDMLAQALRLDIADFNDLMDRALAETEGQDPIDRVLAIVRRVDEANLAAATAYDLYLNALTRPSLRPLAVEWGDSVIDSFATFLTHDQAVAIAVFLDGHGIRSTLGRSDRPDEAVFRLQLQGLLA